MKFKITVFIKSAVRGIKRNPLIFLFFLSIISAFILFSLMKFHVIDKDDFSRILASISLYSIILTLSILILRSKNLKSLLCELTGKEIPHKTIKAVVIAISSIIVFAFECMNQFLVPKKIITLLDSNATETIKSAIQGLRPDISYLTNLTGLSESTLVFLFFLSAFISVLTFGAIRQGKSIMRRIKRK